MKPSSKVEKLKSDLALTKNKIRIAISCLLLIGITPFLSQAQEKDTLVVGVRESIPNQYVQEKLNSGQYNYLDAFEYELALLLQEYIQENSSRIVIFKKVDQDKRQSMLMSGEIDALLYSFSRTTERMNQGLLFSTPYFQNKAIAMVSKDPHINVNTLGSKNLTIGYIRKSTGEEILKLKELDIYEGIRGSGVDDYTELIAQLKEGQVDAIVGDISRLVYDLTDNQFLFVGNLPTTTSLVKDDYCIAVNPENEAWLKPINEFVRLEQSRIRSLESKWLSNALEDAYEKYYNQSRNLIRENRVYIFIIIGIYVLTILIFARSNQRKSKMLKEKEAIILKESVGQGITELFKSFDKMLKDKIDTEQIAEIGCEMFDKAKDKIVYVGSGGFLSDKKLGAMWAKSLSNCLRRKNMTFERVIDLPNIDFEHTVFQDMENFRPQYVDRTYVHRYIKWLFIQYHNLSTYPALKIYDSRGAALFGYGIVFIIRDDEEVLLFTTNKEGKIGFRILNQELAERLASMIKDVKVVGKEVDREELVDRYFCRTNNLKIMKRKLEEELTKRPDTELSSEMLQEIDKVAAHLNDQFNKGPQNG